MSTENKRELPPNEILDGLQELSKACETNYQSRVCDCASTLIASLRSQLADAEKKLEVERTKNAFDKEIAEDFETALGPHPIWENGCWIKRVEELRKSAEANAKDKDRLDWLSCQYQVMANLSAVVTNLHWWNQDPCNLRESIDAAISRNQ